MPFSHNGFKTTTDYRYFHRWINTLCLTDFYMEISTGVSLLRTAQSLLTGRTIFYWIFPYLLGPRVKKWKNGYPESSKDCYSINSKKYMWCIRNHCIASFSGLHSGTRAETVWWPICVIVCMLLIHTLLSQQRVIKLKSNHLSGITMCLFKMFWVLVSISKNCCFSITHAMVCTICNQIKRNISFSLICICHDSIWLISHKHIITVQRLHRCMFG